MNVSFRNWFGGSIGKARIILFLIAGGGMIAMTVAAIDDRIVERQCKSFVKVPCYIESSSMSREPGRDDRNLPGWNYVPIVHYRYTVDGKEYMGDVVCSRPMPITSKASADDFQQRFGPGANGECLVNPDDPADAMLELPTNAQAQRVAKFGGLAVLLGLCALGLLQASLILNTAPDRPEPRAPGWGEADSGPQDALKRTRQMLKEKLES